MVVLDATMLMLLLRPNTPVSPGPNGVPIDRPQDRVEHLVNEINRSNSKVIIPTPALSEVLVRAGAEASQKIVEELTKWSHFQVRAFDTLAAIEVAAMLRNAMSKNRKKGDSNATWAKLKYDRQIVAIAKVASASVIYSDDQDIRTIAAEVNIPVRGLADLPLPPQDPQTELSLPMPTGKNVGDLFDEPPTKPKA